MTHTCQICGRDNLNLVEGVLEEHRMFQLKSLNNPICNGSLTDRYVREEGEETDGLKPCPFCGGEGRFGEVQEGDNLGGQFIECSNLQCAASTRLIFPAMCEVKSLLAECWNNRPASALASEQARSRALREALAAQHEWHLAQTDRVPVFFGDTTGQVNADEYTDSELYEKTQSALAAYDTATPLPLAAAGDGEAGCPNCGRSAFQNGECAFCGHKPKLGPYIKKSFRAAIRAEEVQE